MMNSGIANALKSYGQGGKPASVEDASPHRLVQMLMERLLEKVATAKGHMARGNPARKGENLSSAIAIIGGLRASLNQEAGGEIARNLDALYEYMERRLLEANVHNKLDYLDEVLALTKEVKSAWDVIPDAAKNTSAPNGT